MKILNKTALRLAVVLTALLFAGCDAAGSLPHGLNESPRPLILVTKNESGIVIKDGDGKLYSFQSSYYFSKIIINSELIAGDEIVGI